MEELNEEVESQTQRIAIKEKRLAQAEASRNYKLCDQLSEEIQELKAAKRAKGREIAIIQLKEKRSMKYKDLVPETAQAADQSLQLEILK